MVFMIVLKAKLLWHRQINLEHMPVISLALICTILGIFTTTATVK